MQQQPLTKDQLTLLIQNYVKQRRQQDQQVYNSIQNQSLKIAFGLISKISYAMFGFAFVYTLLDGDFEKYKSYLNSEKGTALAFFIAFLGVTILVLLREIKEDNGLSLLAKKINNFAVDILRTAFYSLILVFVGPLTLGSPNREPWQAASFYLFSMSTLLFVARKILKWIYFFGEGKQNYVPWQRKDLSNEKGLKQMANFIDYYIKKKSPGSQTNLLGDKTVVYQSRLIRRNQ